MKPEQQVAQLFRISLDDAREYCRMVKKLCDADPKLRNKNFVPYLEMYYRAKPSPETLVELMRVRNVKLPDRKKRKPPRWGKKQSAKTKKDRSTKKSARTMKSWRTKRNKKSKGNWDHPVEKVLPQRKTQARPKHLVPHSVLDNQRVPESKLGRCPHGVPRSRICAICEPEKYREMYGFD